ncbi:axonemal dynein light chain domain-containing protein 1 isoform X1, partial [Tachysurus ichikawai]
MGVWVCGLVLFDIFVNILAHNLAEPAYDADVAQLEYKLVPGDHGLVIRLKGFNHKLPLLLKLIVDYLADFTAALDVFSMFVEQLKKTYFNILIKPERLGKDVRLQILEPSRWSVIQKYQAINKNLTVENLMQFVNKFKSEMFVEGLVQGNVTSDESKVFLQYFVEKLQFQPLPSEPPVLFRVVDLPPKHHLCKVQSLNKGDANSEVTVYYQSGIKSLREHALMELLVLQGLLELVRVEQNIYNIVFHELIRQVSVECRERGQLLAKLRHRYVTLLDRIPRQLISLHTETLAQRALDRRLTEEIICFKRSITQLNKELNQLCDHDEHVFKQAEKAQEDLAKAVKQSQLDSDLVGEYHSLYELQRQRLEGKVAILTEEKDLWSKATYSIALKVIKLNNLQLINRLHVSEQAWSKTAEHFTNVLIAKDSENLNRIMQLTDQWKEQLTGFMENLRETEKKQYESIKSIQIGLVRWHKFCEDNVRSPDVKFEKTSVEVLCNDLKQWSMVVSMLCERYGGANLLSGQETIQTLEQLQDSWVEVCMQLFRRHPALDKEAPNDQAAMRELSHAITELYTQLGIRIDGESGIHQQLITLAGVIGSWANRLKSLIGQLDLVHHSEWLKLEKALGSCINMCEEALVNVNNTQAESEKIKHKPHTKIEINDVLNMLREFVSSQNNFYDYTNLTLCEEVNSLHALQTLWMVDLLLLMVPDQCDGQEPHSPPRPELNVFKDVSFQKLKEDARNLAQKLNYFSKYITSSCQAIIEEMMQKNLTQDDAENEMYLLNKLQRECAEWVDICQILLCKLMGRHLELPLPDEAVPKFIADLSLSVERVHSPVDVYATQERPAEVNEDERAAVTAGERPYISQKMNQQVEESEEDVIENEKRSLVMKLIGYDGQIIEQTLGEEPLDITGTSDPVVRPCSEKAQQAFSALCTLELLQQELL